MKLKCKVLTQEYVMKVKAFLLFFTSGDSQKHWEESLHKIWNNQIEYKELRLAIEARYPGLCTPQYTEKVFDCINHTRISINTAHKCRIQYGEDVLKVEDIFEIIGYEILHPQTELV